MSIVTTIQTIAESLNSVIDPSTIVPVTNPEGTPYEFDFLTAPRAEANEELDDQERDKPFVYLRMPVTAQHPINAAGVIDTVYALAIFFGINSEKAEHQEERQDDIDRMEAAKNEFLSRIFADDSVTIIGQPTSSMVMNDFDMNCDGWYLFLKLKVENVGVCV